MKKKDERWVVYFDSIQKKYEVMSLVAWKAEPLPMHYRGIMTYDDHSSAIHARDNHEELGDKPGISTVTRTSPTIQLPYKITLKVSLADDESGQIIFNDITTVATVRALGDAIIMVEALKNETSSETHQYYVESNRK